MNTLTLSLRRRWSLLYLIKCPQSLRRISSKANLPLGDEPDREELVTTQALEHLRQIPQREWSSCETLDSLLISTSSPSSVSPRVFSEITRQLDYSLGLSFFEYLHEQSPSLQHHEESMSLAFQSIIELSGREPESGEKLLQLYEVAKERKISLNVWAAEFLIKRFGRLGMLNKSVMIYKELDPSMKNTHIRNVVIDGLIRDGLIDDAFKLLDEMLQKESAFPPNEITGDIVFHAVLRGYRKGRCLSDEEIVRLVSKFGAHGVFPSSVWLTRFITTLCKNGRTGVAWDTLIYLMNQGVRIEAPSFNVLLTSVGRSRDLVKMNALWAKMEELDIQPDAVSSGILMNILCKSMRVDEALEAFEQMFGGKNGDFVIKADVIHYNILIDGLCKVGRMKEAEELLTKMKMEEDCSPNTYTYNSLINGYCRAGELKAAKTLVSQMKDQGIEPNVVTLNTIVGGMCRHNGVDIAVQFFLNMQREGVKGNTVTYTALLSAYCNQNNMEKAMHWFNQMLESGCSNDAKVYYRLISGLCQARKVPDAIFVVEKLKQDGLSLDLVAYNMLLELFCSTTKTKEVYEMLSEMENSGVDLDSETYNTLISFFAKIKNFEKIQILMEKMREDRLILTAVNYGAVIEAYCSIGDTAKAMKVFKDMGSHSKVMPNTLIYNALIDAFCRNGNIDWALSLKDEMRSKRVRPNVETYNALFNGLKDKNRMEKVLVLMDDMLVQSCEPNDITVEILTELLSVENQLSKLKRFLHGHPVFTPADRVAPLYVFR